jgi:hypothetical protein
LAGVPCSFGDVLEPADKRFADADRKEVPSFQRHVLPLMGRIGCNGRACHGSFQGQGGFRLSLFGYDFKSDLDAIAGGDHPRVDLEVAADSLILQKPTLHTPHKGGKRLEVDSWQYRILKEWIAAGAKGVLPDDAHFLKLEISPTEVVFKAPGETTQVRVLAHWSDGTVEDVTPLCRYRTNDESVAEIDSDGRIKSLGKGDTHVVAFYDNGVMTTQVMLPVSDRVDTKYPHVESEAPIDRLVVEKLRKLVIVPSPLSDDMEFLRRVSLDISGTLPAPDEVMAFAADDSPDKRSRKIDELLERPAYASWWATKFCDITGNNPNAFNQLQPVNGQVTKQWYAWIHRRIQQNMPYHELVKGIVLATSRTSGESYDDYVRQMAKYFSPEGHELHEEFADRPAMPYYWARNTVRTPDDQALNFSHTFLGVRLQCSQCHKHPFDQWTQDDFRGFAAFFSRMRFDERNGDAAKRYNELMTEAGLKDVRDQRQRNAKLTELLSKAEPIPLREVYIQAVNPSGRDAQGNRRRGPANLRTPKVLGGDKVTEQLPDPRVALMDWMLEQDNPYFAKAIVNRIWSHYFGIGIVEPPDDLNLANPPSNAALLDYLAAAFVEHGYDLKWLHREITNSRTYQLSWQTNETNQDDTRNFSHATVRRLPAEVAYDAIMFATAGSDQLQKMHQDTTGRAIADLRSNRRDGRAQNVPRALRIFGQPDRATACDCERSTEPSLSQSLYLLNDDELFGRLNRSDGRVAELTRTVSETARQRQRDRDAANNKEQRIQEVERRIEQLRQNGREEDAANLERRLASIRRGAIKEDGTANQVAQQQGTSLDTDELVREMYLRTLSRMPTDQEMSRNREFLTTARDPVSGIRDVLWALMNTKEFIVNH